VGEDEPIQLGTSNLRAVKFSSIGGTPHPVAITWTGDDRSVVDKLANSDKYAPAADDIWYEWMEEGEKAALDEQLDHLNQQHEFYSNSDELTALALIPRELEYGIVVLPAEGRLTAYKYQVMDLVTGVLLSELLAKQVAGKPDVENEVLQEYAGSLLVTLLKGACEYKAAGFIIDSDLHPENVIYDENRGKNGFHLIDAPLTACSGDVCDDGLRKYVAAAISLALQVLHWDMIGLSLMAHHQDQIYLSYADDCHKLRKALPRHFLPESMGEIKVFLQELAIDEEFGSCLES
jgi:hypothetical protein